jgi:mRNA interferase HigB
MKVVGRHVLDAFSSKHPPVRKLLQAWLVSVNGGQWSDAAAFIEAFPNASEIPGNRVKFKIKGGQYRLIIKVNYAVGIVDIRFVGTHEEYDRIDAEKI